MVHLPTRVVKGATAILMGVLALAAFWLLTGIVITVLNADFQNRSPQSVVLRSENDPNHYSLKVKLIVHRLLIEENSVEVSLALYARYDQLPEALRNEEPCFTLMYGDRSDVGAVPKTYDVVCKQFHIPGKAIGDLMSFETPPFKLTAYPSLYAYPLDDWEFVPYVSLLARANLAAPAEYSVVRMIPGKVLEVGGDPQNWVIRLQRPLAERALVLTVGFAFLALCLLIASRLFSRDVALSGMQELLALAGFVVAIASLRDMLGVSRTVGVSIWEMVVIGLPMLALCVGMAYAARRRMSGKQQNNPPDTGK